MKLLKLALCAAVASTALGASAMAQDTSAPTFAFNVGATSDYLFRGLTQTAKDPAVFGGVDMTAGLFYAGAWASNVDWGIETDLYAGVKPVLGPVTFDIGAIYYGYGYAAAVLLALVCGLYFLDRRLGRLEYETFMLQ